MDTDKDFNPFSDEVPYVPIDRLRTMQAHAKYLIRSRTESQFKEASSTIDWLISEYFYTEKESWIHRQLENGSSILRYLRYEDRTEYGLRELIEHSRDIHPSELDFPNEGNTRSLEALEGALEGINLDDQDFPDAKVYEYIAILALTLIGQTVRSYQNDDWPYALKDDLPMIRHGAIANDSVDIMEAVCRAEQLKIQHETNKRIELLNYSEKNFPKRAEEFAKKKVSLSASLAASVRHKETSQNKSKALLCWDSTGVNFSTKTAFARNKHKEYGVTERTLYGWVTAYERSKT